MEYETRVDCQERHSYSAENRLESAYRAESRRSRCSCGEGAHQGYHEPQSLVQVRILCSYEPIFRRIGWRFVEGDELRDTQWPATVTSEVDGCRVA